MANTQTEAKAERQTLEYKAIKERLQCKALEPPREIIRVNKPVQYITPTAKIQLTTKTPDQQPTYVFILSKQRQDILFIEHGTQIIRLNKLLKQYTQAERTRAQFIELLDKPAIINDITTTDIITEIIYKFSIILDIPLNRYISDNTFKGLITYYYLAHKLGLGRAEQIVTDRNKQEQTEQST